MQRIRLLAPVLILITLVAPLSGFAQAQDSGDNPNPAIMICAQEAGCFHSEKSGEISTEQMTELLGENDTGGDTVVCTPSDGCQWSAPGPEDLDILFGGDGEDIGEKQPAPDVSKDSEDDSLFTEMEVGDSPIVPVAGTWTGYNLAGVMDCGVMSLDIPASPPESGELIVADDGATLTLNSPDPEMGVVPMQRVQNGVYHGDLEITTDEGVMTLDYNEVFVAETMAFGMISGEINSQGMECVITRPFFAVVEGMELLDAPLSDEEAGTDTGSD